VSCERSDRVVQRFALVTLVLPAVVTAVGPAVQLAALPQAPVADPGVSPRNLRVADHHRDVPSAARASERHVPTRSACGSRRSPGSPWGSQPLWSAGSYSQRVRVWRPNTSSPRSNWRVGHAALQRGAAGGGLGRGRRRPLPGRARQLSSRDTRRVLVGNRVGPAG